MQKIYSHSNPNVDFSLGNAAPKQSRYLLFKRGFDIIFSLFGLAALSPLFLIVAILVKLTSNGKVIYGQERIGRRGVLFTCYKFRTMRRDAESHLKHLFENYPEALEEWTKTRKLKNDPRITPLGKYLRRSSLDELPQLWNVLKGDLSLVGPRPVVKSELETYYKAKSEKILSIRPGITGLWQISGRNNLKYEERVRLDEAYIDGRSFLLDLQILFKTLPAVFNGDGAY